MFLEAVAAASRSSPYFRGKAAFMNALAPRRGVRTASVFGLPMVLDLSDMIQRWVFLGCYEQRETAIIKRVLTRGGVFVDAGANIGWFTALAATIVGNNGIVLAFEPSPYAYDLLSSTVAGCANVRAFRCGLSDHDGEIGLFVPPETYAGHDPSMVEYCADMTPITVPVRRLDAVLEELGISRVDLIKIDVEAHEPEVFSGCQSLLRRGCIQHILCEFNDPLLRQRGTSSRELLDYLRCMGYRAEHVPEKLEGRLVNLLLHFGQ